MSAADRAELTCPEIRYGESERSSWLVRCGRHCPETPQGQLVFAEPASRVAETRCTTPQQNAHITEQREVLYRWHPWYRRKVSIVATMARGGAALFRCHTEGSSRALDVTQWMFDAAACCRTALAAQALVSCRALYDLRDLIQAIEQIPSKPELPAAPLMLHTAGGAHANQDSTDLERTAAAVRADRPAALDGPSHRGPRANGRFARASAATAHAHAPGPEVRRSTCLPCPVCAADVGDLSASFALLQNRQDPFVGEVAPSHRSSLERRTLILRCSDSMGQVTGSPPGRNVGRPWSMSQLYASELATRPLVRSVPSRPCPNEAR